MGPEGVILRGSPRTDPAVVTLFILIIMGSLTGLMGDQSLILFSVTIVPPLHHLVLYKAQSGFVASYFIRKVP